MKVVGIITDVRILSQEEERKIETHKALKEYIIRMKVFLKKLFLGRNYENVTPLEDTIQKRWRNVNYPPTPEAMGWASRVNAPTNVGNLP